MASLLSLDLHCHLLPGIDDGAKTLDDSVAIAQRLVEEGLSHVVASSHIMADLYPNTRDILLPLVASTQAHFDGLGIPLTLVAGAEVRLDVDSCRPETWVTIGDAGKFMLVELPTGMPLISSIEAQLFGLQAQGITPIIAHPERMIYLQKEPALLEKWVSQGVLTQGTMCVLAGAASERTVGVLEGYLRQGLVHFMGTDAHGVDRRLRDMAKAAERLEAIVGPENARLIGFDNPSALLGVGEVRRPTPVDAPAPEGFMSKLLGAFRKG
jgi:protein-tyrosine phosphatase